MSQSSQKLNKSKRRQRPHQLKNLINKSKRSTNKRRRPNKSNTIKNLPSRKSQLNNKLTNRPLNSIKK